ncbi:MAB_1171c family putative transporter [Streptomyces sp. NPDC056835]|uniref:MAB_1171c family putative transporter n=1 Tax=Streptomyces sp. NPDC056835 TaxID=3345956 RepID=UPI00369E69F7
MKEVLHPISLTFAVLGLALLLLRARSFRGDPALAALAAVFALSGASFAVSFAPVWTRVDRALDVPNASALIAHICVITMIGCQQVILACWGPPERARRTILVCGAACAAVIVALVVLFANLTPSASRPVGFTAYFVHTDVYRAYLTLYIVAYAVGEVWLARTCWRHARRTSSVWVARGLYTVAAGSVITLGYSGIRIGGVVASLAGGHLDDLDAIAWICGDLGAAVVLLGWLVPTLALTTVRVRTRLRERDQYRQLGPLWEALHSQAPGISLDTPPSHDGLRDLGVDLGWHLYRRAVEIRDGQRILRPHLSPAARSDAETRHRAAGLTGQDLTLAVTADQIRHALDAMASGRSPQTDPADYAEIHGATGTPDDNLRALLRIAKHFSSHRTAPVPVTTGDHR